MTYTGRFRLTKASLVLYCMYKLNKRAKIMKKILTVTAIIASLGLASTPAKADSSDFIKVIGAVVILDSLFNNNRNDNRNYDDRYYNGRNNGYGHQGGMYDDRGIYERTCNDNLGCTPRDNNRWNEPRKHGYADGRYSNGAANGRVCGQRVEHFRNYSETLHLDCNGNLMYITRHQK